MKYLARSEFALCAENFIYGRNGLRDYTVLCLENE